MPTSHARAALLVAVAAAVLCVAAAAAREEVNPHAPAAAHDHASHACCGWMWRWTINALAVAGGLSFGTWLLTVVWVQLRMRGAQNLKKKYDAKWAVVTGGSSGIGRSLAFRLARDGLNLVIIAIGDELLDETMAALKKEFPDQSFRSVGVNLGGEVSDSYMGPIKETTNDLLIQVIFCNAGFMTTGFFTEVAFGRQLANYHCNATSSMHIAHHFVTKLRKSGKRGCVSFTSSPASFMPTPFSAIYGSTKAFLTEFGASLAPEVRRDGIDVLVFHPSPVATRFYDKAHSFSALEMFKATAVTPDIIAREMLASVGRITVRDQGYYPFMMRTLLKLIDVVFMTEIITRTAHTSGDFKKLAPKRVKAD